MSEDTKATALALLDRSRWTMATEQAGRHVRCVFTHVTGATVRSTWWGVDDGSAEAEAGGFLHARLEGVRAAYGLSEDPAVVAARQAAREEIRAEMAHMRAEHKARAARPPTPPYTPPAVIELPGEARDLRLDEVGCACHISPPCDLCSSLTEQEADAYLSAGVDGLRLLWAAYDEVTP